MKETKEIKEKIKNLYISREHINKQIKDLNLELRDLYSKDDFLKLKKDWEVIKTFKLPTIKIEIDLNKEYQNYIDYDFIYHDDFFDHLLNVNQDDLIKDNVMNQIEKQIKNNVKITNKFNENLNKLSDKYDFDREEIFDKIND